MKNITQILKDIALKRLEMLDDEPIETSPLNDYICQIRWSLYHAATLGHTSIKIDFDNVDPAIEDGAKDYLFELQTNGLKLRYSANTMTIFGWIPETPLERDTNITG